MAFDIATILATVSGALISGIIGILYSEYRSKREQHKELKSWYTQLINLSRRTQRIVDEEFDADPDYIRNSIAGNLGKLTSQIMSAPAEVEEDVIVEAEKLAQEFQKIQTINQPNDSIITFLSEDRFIEQAHTVEETAQDARENVSWL